MIFVTVGTQLPFTRLISSLDVWCSHTEEKVIAQIGHDNYLPKQLEYKDFYSHEEMTRFFQEADLVVAHAGMGTIISCLKMRKPLIVMPRMKINGEHRNDHQVDTAIAFKKKGMLNVAMTEPELFELLGTNIKPYMEDISDFANVELLDYLSRIIAN